MSNLLLMEPNNINKKVVVVEGMQSELQKRFYESGTGREEEVLK